MRAFLSALSFLTIMPMPARVNLDSASLGRSTVFFPLIGLLIGLFVMTVSHLLYYIFPPQVAALLVVGFLAGASGALHLDGLADTCDGFLSARPREKVLVIMRDSRIGTMGVAGIIFLVLGKWTSLRCIPTPAIWSTIVLMPVSGRTALLVMMAVLPYARAEGGLGTAFLGARDLKWLGVAIGTGLMVVFSVTGFGRLGVIVTATSLGFVLVFCALCYRRIGGYTGDTLGAICEMAELVPALIAVAVVHGGGCL